LNTEISQRVITSSLTALNWLKGTFFYVRANKNPTSCGVHVVSAQSLDAHLMYLCETALKQLRDNGIIELDNESGLVPLPASHIMSQHMVAFDAMKILVALPFDTSQCQVLEALSGMERMQKPVRRDEKKHLNEAHKVIKYKLKGPASKTKIQTPSQKAFVLLQAAVGQHYFDESTLRQEMSTMVEFSCRILAAAEEYSFLGSKHGRVALQCLKLRRALATSLWSENDGILNQLRGVGQSTAGCLRLHGITHFRDVLRSSEEELETKGRRLPPFGTQLRAAVLKILLSTLILTASHERSIDASVPSTIVCSLKRNDSMPNHDPLSVTVTDKKTSAITYTLLAFTDRPGGCLFFQSNITSPREITFRCPEKFGRISIHLVASLVGLDGKNARGSTAKILNSSSLDLDFPSNRESGN
jgi:ATP-dependent DNA helicase HFM1/MER3